MSEVDFDKDVTMAIDGVQQKWTFERLSKAQEQGSLHECVDWTDDGAPMTGCVFESDYFKNKGEVYFGRQDKHFYFSYSHTFTFHGVEIHITTHRSYYSDLTTSSTSGTIRFGESDYVTRHLPTCNKKQALADLKAYVIAREKLSKKKEPLAGVENDACSLYYHTEGVCNG